MICTLTARRLKPGAFDAFREEFEKAGTEDVPQGSSSAVLRWVRRQSRPGRALCHEALTHFQALSPQS